MQMTQKYSERLQSLQDDLDRSRSRLVSEQCGIAASKGNQILGLIRKTIMYKENQLIVQSNS